RREDPQPRHSPEAVHVAKVGARLIAVARRGDPVAGLQPEARSIEQGPDPRQRKHVDDIAGLALALEVREDAAMLLEVIGWKVLGQRPGRWHEESARQRPPQHGLDSAS